MDFEIEGKCLCYHGPLLYEARVLRIYCPETNTYRDKQNDKVTPTEDDKLPMNEWNRPLWFVHYQGWKATWDEWVTEERIRPYNEENLALKKQLVQDAKEATVSAKKAKSKGNFSSSSGSGCSSSSNRREYSPSVKGKAGTSQDSSTPANLALQDPQGNQSFRILLRMPVSLKSLLVDDWEYITKDRKLLELPCKPSVMDILKSYQEEKELQLLSPLAQTLLHEFTEGLSLYFDQSLSHILLYRLERPQFDDICGSAMSQNHDECLSQQDPRPHTVYGGIHLIRLLSMIPELISSATMDEKSCQTIIAQSEALLNWISNHVNDLIPNRYINTSAQYENVALGM